MPVLIFTGSGTWTPPSDWPGFATKIECVGPGGNGSARISTTQGGNGGGGGEYAAESGVIYITGSKSYTVGTSGSGTATVFPADNVTVTAHAGSNATAAASGNGAGGLGSTNTVHFNGGAGRATPAATASGGGGGGAGGPSGAGSAAPSNIGGAADNSTVAAPAAGVAGNSGTEWTTAGCGTGGSGFASATHNGTAGGVAGGGGSGASDGSAASTGGAGGRGLIVVTYVSANLVPAQGSIQVIAYPPPRHLVLPGALLYRQQTVEIQVAVTGVNLLPPSPEPSGSGGLVTPNPGATLGTPLTSPTGGVAGFGVQLSGFPTPALQGAPASATPSPLMGGVNVNPFGVPTTGAAGQLTFEGDAAPSLVAASATSARGALTPQIGTQVILVAVSTAAANVLFADPSVAPNLGFVQALGAETPISGGPPLTGIGATAAASGAVTALLGAVPGGASATGNVMNLAPTQSAITQLASAAITGVAGLFVATPNLFPAESGVQVIVYPLPQHNVLLPNILYYRGNNFDPQAAIQISLQGIGALAAASTFSGLVPLSAAAAIATEGIISARPAGISSAAAIAAVGLLSPANFLIAEGSIQVIVFPAPAHLVTTPGVLYYRQRLNDPTAPVNLLLPAVATFATVGQIGPALYAPAADPIGTAAPFTTAQFTAVSTASAIAPLSFYETGLNISISATGTVEPFGPSALLGGILASGIAAQFVQNYFFLVPVAALGVAGGLPETAPLLGLGIAASAANSFGLVQALTETSATGTPGIIFSLLSTILSAAPALGQEVGFTLSPIVSLTGTATAAAASQIGMNIILVGVAANSAIEQFSFLAGRFVPMALAPSVATVGSITASLGALPTGVASTASQATLVTVHLPPLVAISAVANAQNIAFSQPFLNGVFTLGNLGPFSGGKISLQILPEAIALGQPGIVGAGATHFLSAQALAELENMILEILVLPSTMYYPVSRGRIIMGSRPARMKRTLQ